jgi:acyl-coenzyme A synthetase/AMP-(fatty) acid ligase
MTENPRPRARTTPGIINAPSPIVSNTGPNRQGAGLQQPRGPGYAVQVMDEAGHLLKAGEQGSIVIALPLPPGCSQTLWGDHSRYLQAYLHAFPGYYNTGDGGYMDEEGFADHEGYTTLATIDDPAILVEIAEALA